MHDPRCLYPRHDLATLLFIALTACLYGAKSTVEIADFGEANSRCPLSINRKHWTVENHLHRQRNVVFYEDDARTRKNYGPQNLGVIRRIALGILRAHPDNRPIARKMKRALWKREFFYELFTHMR